MVRSAIGPMRNLAPPYIGPDPVKMPLASRTTRHAASTGVSPAEPTGGADAALGAIAPSPAAVAASAASGSDHHADHRTLRTMRDQRAQQPDRVGGAAGSGIVLDVGEHHRLGCGLGQTHCCGNRLVGGVEPTGEGRLPLLDEGGETIRLRFGRVLVVAVDDERRTALGDVGRREAGRVDDADDPLIVRAGWTARSVAAALDLGDQLEDAFGRLHQGALPDQRDQEIELPIGLVERPAVA